MLSSLLISLSVLTGLALLTAAAVQGILYLKVSSQVYATAWHLVLVRRYLPVARSRSSEPHEQIAYILKHVWGWHGLSKNVDKCPHTALVLSAMMENQHEVALPDTEDPS